MVALTKAELLCHMHQWRCQGFYHHSDLCSYLETFQKTAAEDPVWSQEFSETDDQECSFTTECSDDVYFRMSHKLMWLQMRQLSQILNSLYPYL